MYFKSLTLCQLVRAKPPANPSTFRIQLKAVTLLLREKPWLILAQWHHMPFTIPFNNNLSRLFPGKKGPLSLLCNNPCAPVTWSLRSGPVLVSVRVTWPLWRKITSSTGNIFLCCTHSTMRSFYFLLANTKSSLTPQLLNMCFKMTHYITQSLSLSQHLSLKA